MFQAFFPNLDADFVLGQDDNTCTQVYMSMCLTWCVNIFVTIFFGFQCVCVYAYMYIYILMCTCIAEVVGDRTRQEPFEPIQQCQTGRLALPKGSCWPPWLLYICIHVYNVSMYLCIHVSVYLCIYVSMYLCIYVSMYLCI